MGGDSDGKPHTAPDEVGLIAHAVWGTYNSGAGRLELWKPQGCQLSCRRGAQRGAFVSDGALIWLSSPEWTPLVFFLSNSISKTGSSPAPCSVLIMGKSLRSLLLSLRRCKGPSFLSSHHAASLYLVSAGKESRDCRQCSLHLKWILFQVSSGPWAVCCTQRTFEITFTYLRVCVCVHPCRGQLWGVVSFSYRMVPQAATLAFRLGHTLPLLSQVSSALALLAPGFPNKWSLNGQFLLSTWLALRIPREIVEHSLGCVCVSGEGYRGEEIHLGYLVVEGGMGRHPSAQ